MEQVDLMLLLFRILMFTSQFFLVVSLCLKVGFNFEAHRLAKHASSLGIGHHV